MALGSGAHGANLGAKLALNLDILSGWIGFVVLVGVLNWLLSGNAEGPKGTKIGQVGWIGDDGKLHTFDVGALTGFMRGPRITGLQGAVEAARAGLPPNESINAMGRAWGNTALSYVTGPLIRSGTMAVTGARPGLPMKQVAEPGTPTKEFDPMQSQFASNVKQALIEMWPPVDSANKILSGTNFMGDVSSEFERQATKYTPKTGMSQETIENLPKIVLQSDINNYADAIAKQARKIPMAQRGAWIMDRLQNDQLSPEVKGRAMLELRKKGVWSYP